MLKFAACYQRGQGLSNNPDFANNEQFFWIGDLGCAKRSIRLQKLMHPSDYYVAVVISDELRASTSLKPVLVALPVRKRKVHFDLSVQVANASASGIVASIEPLANLFYANLPHWRRIQWHAPWTRWFAITSLPILPVRVRSMNSRHGSLETWTIDPSLSSRERNFINEVKLDLAEHSGGFRTDDELRADLAELLNRSLVEAR